MNSSLIWWQKQEKPRGTKTLPRGAQADRIADILSRYPQISGIEAAEVVKFLKRARYVDTNQLTSDPSVQRQLDIFIKGHRHEFRLNPTSVVTAIALVPMCVAVVWLLWRSIG